MKQHLRTLIILSAGGVLLLSLPVARGQNPRFYLRADAGGALTRDTELKQFFGENTTGAKVLFDPGVRVAFAAGYQLTDWFAAEAETGVIENRIIGITGAYTHDVTLANVPFLLNVRLQLPTRTPLTPYIGGGGGGAAAVIDAQHIEYGETRMHGTQSDAVFAYQAFGGIRYQLNDHMAVGVEYHYFATTDPSWRADYSYGTGNNRMSFGGASTHTVTAVFSYSF